MKATPVLARSMMLCTATLLGLLIAPTVFLAVFAGGMPDQFGAPLVEQWPLLNILWASNPEAATQVLMQQPLMTIAHGDPVSGGAVWRLSFYPVSLAAQLAVALFAALIMVAGAPDAILRRFVSLLPGMAVLVFVTTYVQVATCCTGGPRWALDIWLFSLAYNSPAAWLDWRPVYAWTEGKTSMLQIALALLGVALLAPAAMRARDASASAPDNQPR